MKTEWIVSAFAVSLVFAACGLEKKDGAREVVTQASSETPTELEGDWRSACVAHGEGSAGQVVTLTFRGHVFRKQTRTFDDASCAIETGESIVKGAFHFVAPTEVGAERLISMTHLESGKKWIKTQRGFTTSNGRLSLKAVTLTDPAASTSGTAGEALELTRITLPSG